MNQVIYTYDAYSPSLGRIPSGRYFSTIEKAKEAADKDADQVIVEYDEPQTAPHVRAWFINARGRHHLSVKFNGSETDYISWLVKPIELDA